MKKIVLFFTLVMLSVCAAGCGAREIPTGLYKSENGLTMEVAASNKFTFDDPALPTDPTTGDYELKNGLVTLLPGNGNTYVFAFEDETLVYDKTASSIVYAEFMAFESLADGDVFAAMEE